MPFQAERIILTADEWAELEHMTQSRVLPAGDVFRARLVLMLADGLSYRTIQEVGYDSADDLAVASPFR